MRIFFRMIHRIDKRFPVQNVDIDVVAGDAEESVEHAGQILNPVVLSSAEPLRRHGGGERDAILRIAIRYFCNGSGGGVKPVLVAAVHWVSSWSERLATFAAVRCVAGVL